MHLFSRAAGPAAGPPARLHCLRVPATMHFLAFCHCFSLTFHCLSLRFPIAFQCISTSFQCLQRCLPVHNVHCGAIAARQPDERDDQPCLIHPQFISLVPLCRSALRRRRARPQPPGRQAGGWRLGTARRRYACRCLHIRYIACAAFSGKRTIRARSQSYQAAF